MASEANWFYAKGRERSGAVTADQLHDLIARNEVSPNDLVWTAGMEKWVPARSVPALFPATASPMTAPPVAPPIARAAASAPPQAPAPMSAASPVATAIPYYTASGGMPARAVNKLEGHARPCGDTGDWPVDDERMNQFANAIKLRKRVMSAANLYRLLLLLSIIATVSVLFATLFGFALSRRGRATSSDTIAMFIAVAFYAGLSTFYYFAWRATSRSRRWAPLTMFIIFLASTALVVIGAFGSMMAGADATVLIPAILVSILPIAFAMMSWRAYATIPMYLAQPAWCQELLVTANL